MTRATVPGNQHEVSQEKSVLLWVSVRFPTSQRNVETGPGNDTGRPEIWVLIGGLSPLFAFAYSYSVVEVVCKSWSQILLAHLGLLDRSGGNGGVDIVHLSCLCVRGQALESGTASGTGVGYLVRTHRVPLPAVPLMWLLTSSATQLRRGRVRRRRLGQRRSRARTRHHCW